MRHLGWIITLPIAAVALSFALSNRGTVAVALWPLPWQLEVPLFLAVLVPAAVAFLLGGLVAWFNAGRTRRLARRRGVQAAELEAEVRRLRERFAAERDGTAGGALTVSR